MTGYIDSDNAYCSTFECASYNVDEFYQARLSFFFSIVQEAAACHALLRKASVPDLNKEGYTWVIARAIYDIEDYPSWPENLLVRTWALDERRYIAPRATEVRGEDGHLVLRCASNWAIVTSDSHRPVKPAFVNQRLVTADDSKPGYANYIESPRLGDISSAFTRTKIDMNYFDLDFNGHVNNIVYLDWMLESLSPEFLHSSQARCVDIAWHKEVYWKDEVYAAVAFVDPCTTRHRIEVANADGTVTIASEAEITWKPRVSHYVQAHKIEF